MSKKHRSWLSRHRGGLTQQQAADMAGISRSYYTEIEAGEKSPSVPAARRLGEALGFDWVIFFEDRPGSGAPEPCRGKMPLLRLAFQLYHCCCPRSGKRCQ